MMRRHRQRGAGTVWRGVVALVIAGWGAQAWGVNCTPSTITIPGGTVVDFAFPTLNSTSGTLQDKLIALSGDNCTQTTYLFAKPSSTNNTHGSGQASHSNPLITDKLSYLLRKDDRTSEWGFLGGGSPNFITAATGTTALTNFYVIDSGTNGSVFPAAGTYTDTVYVYRDNNSNTNNLGTQFSITVAIKVPEQCTLSLDNTTISLTYLAYGPQSSSGRTVTINCNAVYTIKLSAPEGADASAGTLLGLTYSLALAHSSGPTPGQAGLHSYALTATIGANQPGTCSSGSCSASSASGRHSVVVEY